MKILAIETSCDETSAAVIEDGVKVLSNEIASQADLHAVTGGVVPEIAAREHAIALPYIYRQALEKAGLKASDIDAFAATTTPGLIGALLVGTSTAKTLSHLYNKPFISVNHIKGHIFSTYLERELNSFKFPFITLTVSGGHTQIWLINSFSNQQLLGETQDDAAGEAYDKIAKMLGLPYPGGPALAKVARDGDQRKYKLPIAKLDKPLNFSFSGLKTAVLYLTQELTNSGERPLTQKEIADLAASAQAAINTALVENSVLSLKKHKVDTLHLVGGVSANLDLQARLTEATANYNCNLVKPAKPIYSTDNAAMIGAAAYFDFANC